jgi:hypothetical protein
VSAANAFTVIDALTAAATGGSISLTGGNTVDIGQGGTYLINYTAQVDKTGANSATDVEFRVRNTTTSLDLAGSGSSAHLTGTNDVRTVTRTFIVTLAATANLQLEFAASNTNTRTTYSGANNINVPDDKIRASFTVQQIK